MLFWGTECQFTIKEDFEMRTLKIFNFTQANFLIQKKCKIENCGYGKIDHKPYIRFICDETFSKAMDDWKNRTR